MINGNTVVINLLIRVIKHPPHNILLAENYLKQLDIESNKITWTTNCDASICSPKPNYAILEKYWKLVELNGEGRCSRRHNFTSKEPHIIFKDSNRLIGNGGCNSISGEHKIEDSTPSLISKMISIKWRCQIMESRRRIFRSPSKSG